MGLVTNHGGSTANTWQYADRVWWLPFWSFEGGSNPEFQFRVTTGNSTSVTFAVYDQDATTFGPGALLEENTWTSTSNNTNYTWSSSMTLSAHKIYWFATLCDGTPPTIFCLLDNNISPMIGRKMSTVNYAATEYVMLEKQSQTSMPDPAPSIGSMSSPSAGFVPRIGWIY